MTELSIQYGCSPATGDYGSLTVENLATARLFLGNWNITESGVIFWTDSNYVPQIATTLVPGGLSNAVDGLLEPTESGGVVTIDTGVAIVNGYMYFSDETEDFDIDGNPGNANATDIIAARWSAANQRVRLTRINGAAASTAVLTQNTSIWDIPLAYITLDGSGQFSSLNNARKLANAPTSGLIQLDLFVGDGSTNVCTFDNIPSIFSSLLVVGFARSDNASIQDIGTWTFNNDTGANYDASTITGTNSTVTNAGAVAQNGIAGVLITGASGHAGVGDSFRLLIPNYANTNLEKSCLGESASKGNETTGAFGLTQLRLDGWWRDTSAITRVDLTMTGNFVAGSRIVLYGQI